MEEDHDDYDHHNNGDWDVPVDCQPCYNIVEGGYSEDVEEVVQSLFVVNSQTPNDVRSVCMGEGGGVGT